MTDAVNPYAAPQAAVADVPEAGLVLASRWSRLGAAFVDGLAVGVPAWLGFLLVARVLFDYHSFAASMDFMKQVPVRIVYFVAMMALYVFINGHLLASQGQTVGKRLLSIRIVRMDGSRATLRHLILVRWLPINVVSQLPFLMILAFIDLLLIFRGSRRCLHDTIAGTQVVKA